MNYTASLAVLIARFTFVLPREVRRGMQLQLLLLLCVLCSRICGLHPRRILARAAERPKPTCCAVWHPSPQLDSDAAQWDLQHSRITTQPLCKDGRGLPMRCVPRARCGVRATPRARPASAGC